MPKLPTQTFLAAIDPFILSRTFNAPRELVFAAFTEPARMKEWWGPKGFKVMSQAMDLRPGGTYHYGLKSPAGQEMWGKLIFREIAAPTRIVFITCFSDAKGGVTRTQWPRPGRWKPSLRTRSRMPLAKPKSPSAGSRSTPMLKRSPHSMRPMLA